MRDMCVLRILSSAVRKGLNVKYQNCHFGNPRAHPKSVGNKKTKVL